jgi:putative endonuclease
MTRTARQGLGAAGEAHARRHLERQGYRFLEANWRYLGGELDLIVREGDLVVFVEVKTRRGERFGMAEEGISPAQADRLLRAAQMYLETRPDLAERIWRVDLVAITLDRSGAVARLSHIQDAIHSS